VLKIKPQRKQYKLDSRTLSSRCECIAGTNLICGIARRLKEAYGFISGPVGCDSGKAPARIAIIFLASSVRWLAEARSRPERPSAPELLRLKEGLAVEMLALGALSVRFRNTHP
jgi:hypothetical protein